MNNNAKGVVLVTGGTGFLGAYVIQELVEKGYSVRAIRRNANVPAFIPPAIWNKVEWIHGDLLDVICLEDAMEGVDAIIHAAGKVSFNRNDRDEIFTSNVDTTTNVVNVALDKNINRFIHISSVAALGRTGHQEHVDEEKKWTPGKWNTTYSVSKFHSEVEVWRGIGEGLPAVIVNPSTFLGYGDWSTGSCALFRNAWKEFPWYTEGVNGFVDVTDVARATVRLLETNTIGERYILNGDNWTFRHLFNSMADAFGKKRPSKEATPFLAGVAWRLEVLKSKLTGKSPVVTRESARIARSKTYYENKKFLHLFPDFQFTPLEETIKKACQSYLLLT